MWHSPTHHLLPLQSVHVMGLIVIEEKLYDHEDNKEMVLGHLLIVFEPLHGVGLACPQLTLKHGHLLIQEKETMRSGSRKCWIMASAIRPCWTS